MKKVGLFICVLLFSNFALAEDFIVTLVVDNLDGTSSQADLTPFDLKLNPVTNSGTGMFETKIEDYTISAFVQQSIGDPRIMSGIKIIDESSGLTARAHSFTAFAVDTSAVESRETLTTNLEKKDPFMFQGKSVRGLSAVLRRLKFKNSISGRLN